MTNQSKWLISAYAIFFRGGVLVPLDFKLTAAEHLQLLAHSKAKFLIVEYYLWRAIMQSPEFKNHGQKRAGHGSAAGCRSRRCLSLGGFSPQGRSRFRSASARGCGLHRLLLRHRRPSQGMRPHARQLSRAVQRPDRVVPVLAGRALSKHSADQSCHRFYGGLYRPVCLRRVRGAPPYAAA